MTLIRNTLAFAAALTVFGTTQAQSLPEGKQMRLVVPYAAGGTSDIVGRKLAEQLSEVLGRSVIVENRPGAGGGVGTEYVVRADADGTTMLLHSGAIATEVALKDNLPYDALTDLRPITTVVVGPFALLVNNDLPVTSVTELIEYANQNPGKLNYGTPGVGSSVHMTSEYFRTEADIDIVDVPFRGAAPALTAAMAGDIQIVIDPLATAKRFAEAGNLRALAVTTGDRTTLWPEMPTIAEGGVEGFDAAVWYGLYVPGQTPTPIVEQLNAAFVEILQDPETVAWLEDQGLEPVADSPDESLQFLKDDIEKWQALVKAANISIQ